MKRVIFCYSGLFFCCTVPFIRLPSRNLEFRRKKWLLGTFQAGLVKFPFRGVVRFVEIVINNYDLDTPPGEIREDCLNDAAFRYDDHDRLASPGHVLLLLYSP